MFLDASNGFEKEGDWEFFKKGIPANLKLVDGLLEIRPNDTHLLSAAIKGYSGYAFTVNETLYLQDKLADKDESAHLERAIINYTKAMSYGRHYLFLEGVDLDTALKQKNGVLSYLEEHLSASREDLEAVVYTAQAMGSLINLQKSNMLLVSYLPVVKGMFDWACEKDPSIGHGVCSIFYGSYEASRPRMLGGNPEKGRKIFLKFIKENPHQWLARVAYLEHYVIPMENEDAYLAQKKKLISFGRLHRKKLKDSLGKVKDEAFANPRLRLYQATAIKRFNIIRKFEKEIF